MDMTELVSIFNDSFSKGAVLGIWKEVTIQALKNSSMPSMVVISYQPMSHNSCVVKTLERMIHKRFDNLARTRGWLCDEQAGFRRLHSFEEHIVITITRTTSDDF